MSFGIRSFGKSFAGLAAALLALTIVAVDATPAHAGHEVTPARVEGADRFETAAELARLQYPQGTGHAVLALGLNFPDALAAAPLAARLEAPVLLSANSHVPPATLQALDDLGVERVTIIGGPHAIHPEVEDGLGEQYEVDRIWGQDRHGTAAAAIRTIQNLSGNTANFPAGQRALFIASGENFPDALAASGPAAYSTTTPIPIGLTLQATLPPETAAVIEEFDFDLAIIVGGTQAISATVEQQLESMGLATTRLAGADRTATAVEIADFARQYLGFSATLSILARGDDFPDALTVGPHAGAENAPVLLSATPTVVGDPTLNWLSERCSAVEAIRAVGGEAAVTTAALDRAVTAAEDCHRAGEGQTYIVAPQEAIELDPGQSREFEVIGRYDDEALTGPVTVALFPCQNVDNVPGQGTPQFADADNDGDADAIGWSDTGQALILEASNSAEAGPSRVHTEVTPEDDGFIHYTVHSEAVDCTVPVVFDDANEDGDLNVDAAGNPFEDYGVAHVSWTE